MSDNWVVSTLEDALSNWNDKLAEIWSLVSQTPESFRGGEIWTVIVSIHNALVSTVLMPTSLLLKQDGTTLLLFECAWDTDAGFAVQIYPDWEMGRQDLFL